MFWGYITKDNILILFLFLIIAKAWSKIKYICIYDNQIIICFALINFWHLEGDHIRL